jgi:hypothetical protein
LVASSGLSARADAVLMKMVAVGAAALGGVFVWSILGEVVPSAQLVGTVAYGWNPLLMFELAGDLATTTPS